MTRTCPYCDPSNSNTCRDIKNRDGCAAIGADTWGHCELRVQRNGNRIAGEERAACLAATRKQYNRANFLESLLRSRCFDL